MSSFQDPISKDSSEYPTDFIGTYVPSSFQDLLSRPQTESVRTHNMTRYEGNSSFPDLSRPLHTSRTPYNKESLVVLDHEMVEMTHPQEQLTEAPQENIATEVETHFKTLHINGI